MVRTFLSAVDLGTGGFLVIDERVEEISNESPEVESFVPIYRSVGIS